MLKSISICQKKIITAGQTDMNLNQYFKSNVNPGIVPNY